jgi:hypothetical protein
MSSLKSLIASVALAAIVAPSMAAPADAGGKSRKKNGEMMRLGGPATGSDRSRRMMRLGGPDTATRPIDRGIYAIPGRFVSGSPSDVREFFLRRDEAGQGG